MLGRESDAGLKSVNQWEWEREGEIAVSNPSA